MTEEEYFRKNYPNSCYGDKPLSPHWDFFQDGVEFGERQSEKRIEELEKENELLKADLEFSAKTSNKNKQTVKEYQKLVDEYSSEGADLQDRIKELEKENESLENVKNIYIGDLLKAKEIIRMVIDSYNHKERFSFEKDLMKAELFLKGETNGL